MDFLSTQSDASHDTGLDFFEKPIRTGNFGCQNDIIIQPTCPPGDSPHSSYTFILGSKEDKMYSIPSSIKIFGRLRVCLQNGNILTNEKIAPVCNFPESIFENVSVTLNGNPISDHGRGYGFKSYITKKLSLSPTTKNSTLLSNYWIEEKEDPSIKIEGDKLSESFGERSTLIQGSQDVHFIFSPLVDILNTEKYLPPHGEFKFEFERGPLTLPLVSPDESIGVKINILDINMSVRRFLPESSIALQNEKRFLSGDFMNLPFTRSTIRYRTLHSGVLSTVVPGIFTGQLPYSAVIGFLTNEQLGMMNYDPFVFKSHRLKKFNCVKNGVNIPQDPVIVGNTDGSFLRGYTHFIENTGGSIFASTNGISPADYFNKSFFMAFDFTPDNCLGAHNHKSENGTIDLCLQFLTPTVVPLTLIILACYENNIQVNKDEVRLDYAL